jgi:PAS domain S-box-containing protein
MENNDKLRRLAEALMQAGALVSPSDLEAMSPEALRHYLYDLNVHQLELDIRYAELRRTQVDLQDTRSRYPDLYDLAPLACLSLNNLGVILEANITATHILGLSWGALVGQLITRFILIEDHDAYSQLLKQLAANSMPQGCDLRMITRDRKAFWGHLEMSCEQLEDGTVQYRVILSDVSARKQAELALNESENKYRLLIDNVRESIFLTQDGLIKSANSASGRLLGGYSEQELIDKPFEAIIHPDDRGFVFEHYPPLVANEAFPPRYVFRVVDREGNFKWVQISAALIGWQGKPATLNFLTDITAAKQAEDTLRIEEAKYQALTASMKDVVWTLDPETMRLTFVSPSVFKQRGFTPEELCAEPIDSPLAPGKVDGFTRLILERISGFNSHPGSPPRFYTDEVEQPCKDGTTIWTEIITGFFVNSGRLVVQGITRDISRQKQVEEALRHSEEKFAGAFQIAPYALIMTRPGDGACNDVNAAFTTITGYTRQEALANSSIMLQIWDQEADLSAVIAALNSGQVVVGQEYHFRAKTGRIIIGKLSAQFVQLGQERCILTSIEDITQYKLAEEALRLSEEHARQTALLEQQRRLELDRIAEQALLEKTEELARTNREFAQFAYVASHDLQEPLRMVTSYLQLLSQRYTGKLDEKADKFIHYAVDGASRMQRLVAGLLSFSRVTTQAKPFEDTPCGDLLQEVLQDLHQEITESGTTIVIGELPTLLADRSQLKLVFQNLIANAIKFRSEAQPRIEVTAQPMPDGWEFCVADNGIGIDPQFHERVFLIFQKLHEQGKYPGSGIGLAIVKKIVERHGGRIWVESVEGKGSQFWFSLPASGNSVESQA